MVIHFRSVAGLMAVLRIFFMGERGEEETLIYYEKYDWRGFYDFRG
jgi:hypothetical protein